MDIDSLLKSVFAVALAIIGYFVKGTIEDSKANGVAVDALKAAHAEGELNLEKFKTYSATEYAKTTSLTAAVLHLDNKMDTGFREIRDGFQDLRDEIREGRAKP